MVMRALAILYEETRLSLSSHVTCPACDIEKYYFQKEDMVLQKKLASSFKECSKFRFLCAQTLNEAFATKNELQS
jgi:hypothetical protein